jgi:hypothetical protein
MGETSPPTHIDLLYRPHEEIREIQNQRFRHQHDQARLSQQPGGFSLDDIT